jgi:hypothetical protein
LRIEKTLPTASGVSFVQGSLIWRSFRVVAADSYAHRNKFYGMWPIRRLEYIYAAVPVWVCSSDQKQTVNKWRTVISFIVVARECKWTSKGATIIVPTSLNHFADGTSSDGGITKPHTWRPVVVQPLRSTIYIDDDLLYYGDTSIFTHIMRAWALAQLLQLLIYRALISRRSI